MDENKLVFAYGSLLNIVSLGKTIERKVTSNELTQVWLSGYQRIWNYKVQVYSMCLKSKIDAVFLNIEPEKFKKVNGIVFAVSASEFEKLRQRERYYEALEVSSKISVNFEKEVFAFSCINDQHLSTLHDNCVVMQKYYETVVAGCKNWSPKFLNDFLENTEQSSFKQIEGAYSFV